MGGMNEINLQKAFQNKDEFIEYLKKRGLTYVKVLYLEPRKINLLRDNVSLFLYDIRIYLVQDNKLLWFWVDLDFDFEEAMSYVEALPEPTFLVFTGRHYAILYELEDGVESDFDELKLLLLRSSPSEKITFEMKSKTTKNAMIRPPFSLNSKTEKEVVWYRVGKSWITEKLKDEFLKIVKRKEEEKKKEFSYLPFCNLAKECSANWDDLRYDGWRFLSYIAVLKKDFRGEFEEKSYDWELKHKPDQTTDERLKYSEREVKENKIAFWYCSSIAKMDLDEIRGRFCTAINEHPCSKCKYNQVRKLPFFQSEDFVFPDGFVVKDKMLFYKDELWASKFKVKGIMKEVYDTGTEYYFIVEEEEKTQKVSINDLNALKNAFFYYVNDKKFRDFLQSFISLNSHSVIVSHPFTGRDEKGKWYIYNKDYFHLIVDEIWDCSISGKEEDFRELWSEIVKIVMDGGDYVFALMIGTALRFLYQQNYYLVPTLLVRGRTGAGKTLRGALLNTLVRKPQTQNFDAMTRAFILNNIPKIKSFLVLDEFSTFREDYEEILYHLINKAKRETEKGKFFQNTSPMILMGESTRIRDFTAGLKRRIFEVELTNSVLNAGYVEIMKKIWERRCWGYLFALEKDIFSNLNLDTNFVEPDEFIFSEHFVFVNRALSFFKAFAKSLLGKADISLIVENLRKDELNERRHQIPFEDDILKVFNYLHKRFNEKKVRLFFSEVKKTFGFDKITGKVIEILFCDRNYSLSNGKYSRPVITSLSPFYLYLLNPHTVSFDELVEEIKKKVEGSGLRWEDIERILLAFKDNEEEDRESKIQSKILKRVKEIDINEEEIF